MHEMIPRQGNGFALGFGTKDSSGQVLFQHNGQNAGFACDLEAFTESGHGVAIMTNGEQGGALVAELVRAVAEEYGWPDLRAEEHTLTRVDPAVLATYVGNRVPVCVQA